MLQTQEVMECRFRQPDAIACACTPTVLPLQYMTFKKILVILIVFSLFVLPASYAALNTGLQAPDEFEKSDIWDTAIFDSYSLKTDKNVQLEIMEYDDEMYDTLFKDDTELGYYVNDLGNNIFMGKDNDLNDGYILEVIEFNGNKYIVNTYLNNTPTNDQIKDSMKYITEFNELNNVEPISA